MIEILKRCAFASALFVAMAASAIAAPPTDVYGKLPAVEQVTLSPSGKRVAFVAVVGEKRKIVVADVGGKGLFALPTGSVKVRDLTWAGEDHILITQSSTVKMDGYVRDQYELSTAVAINVETRKVLSLLEGHSEVKNVLFGVYGTAKLGDRWYVYVGALGHHGTGDPDLYQVDLDTGALKEIARGWENSADWLVGTDGKIVARSNYDARTGAWHVYAGENSDKLLASGQYRFGGVSLYHGRKEDTLLIRRPTEKGDFDDEIPLAGGAAGQVADNDIIDGLMFDRTKGLWVGFTTIGDVPNARMFDPYVNGRVSAARKAFPGRSADVVSWSDDFARMIVFTSGSNDSGSYWIVDIANGSANIIGVQYPGVPSKQVGPISMVEWKAADGTVLHGVLSLPPGREARNLPIVVLPHGGPEARDYPVFDWWAQAFASQGYAVLQPNFRGSSGYGTEFRDAGFGQWGRKMQTDVSDGLADLARKGVVDPKRACIVGASYGGYAALAGVTVQQGLYRCAVSVAGVADLAGMLKYEDDGYGERSPTTRYWKTFMGSDIGPVSPLRLAAKADAPVLLIHGKDDTVVPYSQSEDMERALKSAGKTVTLVTLEGEDHWLSREETRGVMLKSAVAFVEKYNPPDPLPTSH